MPDLDRLAAESAALGIALHSVEMTLGGETILRAACRPAGPDVPHRTYSVSKTVTGLAVGLLAAEGHVDLDASVTTWFGEHAAFHPWLEATTLRDVLAMRGPHAATTFRPGDPAWLASYFTTTPTHPPGTLFTYDTSGSYALAALVERVTGTSLVDYLRPRLLDPLGVSADVRFLRGPDGYSHGGSGLVCRPHDLLLLARLVLAGGVHDGVALLPADFLRDATSPQVDTATQTWGTPFRGAYGYQQWLPERGGFLWFGLGGQIVAGDPRHDLALVVTADTQACQNGDQRLVELVERQLLDPFVATSGRPAAPSATTSRAPSAELAWPVPGHRAEHAVVVTGRYRASASAGPATLDLDLRPDGVVVTSADDGWRLATHPGRALPGTLGPDARPCVVAAGWSAPRTLDVTCWMLDDELATFRLRLHVGADDTVAVRAQGFGEGVDPRWTFVAAYAAASEVSP